MTKEITIKCYDVHALEDMYICSGCFFRVERYHRFCHNCGAQLAKTAVTPTTSSDWNGFEYIAKVRKQFQESKKDDI